MVNWCLLVESEGKPKLHKGLSSAQAPSVARQASTRAVNDQHLTALPRHPLDEKSAAPASPPQPYTPQRSLRPVSVDFVASTPHRHGIDTSPHLRPVPDSELNRSASLRTPKSAPDSGLLRRLSSRRRNEDRRLKEYLEGPGSPISIPTQISEEPAALDRAGSKRKRVTAEGSPVVRNSKPSLSVPDPPKVTMTNILDNTRFNLGSLDIFSPHPTIRCSLQSRNPSALSVSRPGSSPRPLSKQTLQQSKTVDDLANDLDAATLRKLMERDQRRRERKRKAEEERAKHRLNQYAARADHREDGLYEDSSRVSQDILAEAGPSRLAMPFVPTNVGTARRPDLQVDVDQNPFADPIPPAAQVNIQAPTPAIAGRSPFDDPVLYTARTVRYSQASMSPPASPRQHARHASSVSQIPDLRAASMQDISETTDPSRRASGSGRAGPLAALFRRSVPGLRVSEDKPGASRSEGSFSNLSRDSMSRQPPPIHLRDDIPASPKTPASATYRAKSRFIEDLPELPLSPPDSRIQSPERIKTEQAGSAPMPIINQQSRSSPALRQRSRTDSLEPEEATAPAAGTALSQSFASVDSEASWLSGKKSRRLQTQAPPTPKLVVGSLPAEDLSADSYARIPIPEKNPARNRLGGIRTALAAGGQGTGLGITPSPIEEHISHGEVTQNSTVFHEGSRVKSAEGILNQWSGEEAGTPPRERTSLETAGTDEHIGLHETPYLEGAHARHLSAGSARLLDIPARQDSQRSSISFSPAPSR